MDKELAGNLLRKEAQINKLFSPSKNKARNIHDNPASMIGQKNLDGMHNGPFEDEEEE